MHRRQGQKSRIADDQAFRRVVLVLLLLLSGLSLIVLAR